MSNINAENYNKFTTFSKQNEPFETKMVTEERGEVDGHLYTYQTDFVIVAVGEICACAKHIQTVPIRKVGRFDSTW